MKSIFTPIASKLRVVCGAVILFAFELFVCIPQGFGQTYITIGTGTNVNTGTSYPAPYGNYYWGAKHQMLIRASELTAAGASAGNISSLGFNVATVNGVAMNSFTIKIKSTSATAVTGTFDNSGFTTVYGPQNYTESSGWNTHTFSSSFYWNGTSNLLIETCFNNTSYTNNALTYYSTTSFNSSVYYYADASGVCSTTSGTTTANRPNMRLAMQPSNVPPTVKFSGMPSYSCNGIVTFKDSSTNNPTSWFWDFGDGDTSTLQNPSHTYANGIYSISLKACNSYGCDSLTKTNYITVDTALSVTAAVCSTSAINYCCGYGIYKFTLNTLSNTSNDASEGYQDFTCLGTTVTEGFSYSVSIQTGTNEPEDAKIWIDFNNDGSFNDTTERVFSSYNSFNASGTVTIPGGAVLNIPLRMRVISDEVGSIFTPCTDIFRGQAEDYAIIIVPNTNPPVADFGATATSTCTGTISFADSSSGIATSWLWTFGDGQTDTLQNPTHTYSSTGTYTVKLVVCNSFGCDSMTKTNYINVISTSGGPVAASCTPATSNYCCGIGIYNVTFNTINNTTNDGSDGYKDYSCSNTTNLTAGTSYNISILTSNQYDEYVYVWIDFNNDGNFNSSNELVFSDWSLEYHYGNVYIPGSVITGTPLRMRVLSDYNSASGACTNPYYGQIEDYSIIVQPNTNPPAAYFSGNPLSSCSGVITFTDTSYNTPTSWLWSFGDGTTDTLQNPVHTYTANGTYSVKLVVCNAYGCDSVTKTNYIQITLGATPVAASCSPNTTGYCCGIGIYNVTLNTINNTTSDGIDGYKDYTCNYQTSLTAGVGYTLSIQTSTYQENVRVWIDYNNNGSFNASAELAFSINNSSAGYHTGTIIVPGSAVVNTPLRMRVYSDYYDTSWVPSPAPCSNPNYGQIEDYTITILPNTNPPVANFSANPLTSCTGIISFTDSSLNVPTSWLWNFGDGQTSTQQNPSHTYTANGTYTVKLVVCNSYGCDSVTKSNYIQITLGQTPVAASCSPNTIAYCCGYGVYNVSFNTINNTTNDGIDGYKDYTCNNSTNVTVGNTYSITVLTSSGNWENVRVWIDYNNNGVFSAGELVFTHNDYYYHNGNITIPGSAVLNTALRMRVYSDNNSPTNACTNPYYGQTEDYSVIIQPNTNPPSAMFTANNLVTCSGTVNFTDTSSNNPTSWLWSFGDGTTDTLQNPTHNYTASGTYTVTMKACNAFGCDSVTKTNYITVNYSPQPVTASCIPNTQWYCCGYGIYNVTLNTINNTTPDAVEGYKSYTCGQQTNLIAGQTYSVSVTTSSSNYEYVRIWIDYNNNGVFSTNEQVFTSNNTQFHSGNITIPVTGVVTNTALRMRVFSDYTSPGTGCPNPYYGQVEDYTVTVFPNNIPPIGNFNKQVLDECQGIVKFTDNSVPNPTGWLWDFGDDIGISSQQNPYYAYDSAGIYTVTLIVSNAFGSDTVIQTITINVLTASFSVSGNPETGAVLDFSDNSPGAITWNWTFGDGYSANIQNPSHVYTADGTYDVKLTVTNSAGCVAQAIQQVVIIRTGINEEAAAAVIVVYPNPNGGRFELSVPDSYRDGNQSSVIGIKVYNLLGEVVLKAEMQNTKTEIDLSSQGQGVYTLEVTIRENKQFKKVVVE